MRRTFLFSILIFSLFLITQTGCCSHTNLLHPVLSGVDQAQHENQAAVALVVDFVPDQPAFCTGVWVAKDTILTAKHCVKGYIDMQHRYLVMQVLQHMGLPSDMAYQLSGADVASIPADLQDSPIAQLLIQANAMFPKLDPMSVTLQY